MVFEVPAELAGKIMNTLRGAPMLVALLLVNTMVMGLVGYALTVRNTTLYTERSELIRIVDRCITVGALKGAAQ